jgi:NAD(P)-dependent dehydrogenase (short-subunit alcohol dehydrogenase family)
MSFLPANQAVGVGLDAFGKIDGAIANAGLWDFGPRVWGITEEKWRMITGIVLGGVFRTIKAVPPQAHGPPALRPAGHAADARGHDGSPALAGRSWLPPLAVANAAAAPPARSCFARLPLPSAAARRGC